MVLSPKSLQCSPIKILLLFSVWFLKCSLCIHSQTLVASIPPDPRVKKECATFWKDYKQQRCYVVEFLKESLGDGVEHDGLLHKLPLARRSIYLRVLRNLYQHFSKKLISNQSDVHGTEKNDQDSNISSLQILTPILLSQFFEEEGCFQSESNITGDVCLSCRHEQYITTDVKIKDMFKELMNFFQTIFQYSQVVRVKSRPADQQDILVIGGGPSGLVSSIHSLLLYPSINVTVLEKRYYYSRNIWFDLYGQPWYSSIDVLKNLGLMSQAYQTDISVDEQGNISAITMRASALEHFLLKIAVILGAKVHHGADFMGLCSVMVPDENSGTSYTSSKAVIFNFPHFTTNLDKPIYRKYQSNLNRILGREKEVECSAIPSLESKNCSAATSILELLTFDVLVGADGGKSKVRDAAGVRIHKHENYTWHVKLNMGGQDKQEAVLNSGPIRQVSILMNFKVADAKNGDGSLKFDGGDARYPTNQCPKMKLSSNNQPLDPWAIGFHPIAGTSATDPFTIFKKKVLTSSNEESTDGVYAVFKRFYYQTCQLQLLFLHRQGESLLSKFRSHTDNGNISSSALDEDDGVPWSTLLRVSNELLASPFASIQELQNNLVSYDIVSPYSSQHSHSLFEYNRNKDNISHDQDVAGYSSTESSSRTLVRVIDIQLQSAASIIGELAPLLQKSDQLPNNTSVAYRKQYYFLTGDASFLAHYRLGVGINAIFTTVTVLQKFLHFISGVRSDERFQTSDDGIANSNSDNTRSISGSLNASLVVHSLAAEALELVQKFITFQLSTMFFESFCDFIVFFNSDARKGPANVLDSQVLYVRDPQYEDYILPPWNWEWSGAGSNTQMQTKFDESPTAEQRNQLFEVLSHVCSK